MTAREFRLDYINLYASKLDNDTDYLRYGGANEIIAGMRILIDRYPRAARFNALAEKVIGSAVLYSGDVRNLIQALRKLA